MSRYTVLAILIPMTWGSTSLLGCYGGSGGGPNEALPVPGESSLLVEIEGGPVATGFAIGKLRRNDQVKTFQITKHPITLAEYRTCVESNICKGPALQTCTDHQSLSLRNADLSNDAAPAVCVAASDARRYCEWTGGRLPILSEWLLAARGAGVRRHAWGNESPTCEQHPLADLDPTRIGSTRCAANGEQPALAVGEHSGGASPYGVEDVLLTPGELVGSDPSAVAPACSSEKGACIAYGLSPGAIDSVVNAPRSGVERHFGPDPAYGFRCVVEGT